MKKRILSLLLVFVMCLTMLPTSSLAAGKVALKISAANASPSKGDTVTFSVTVGEVKNLTNMEFVIDVPEGLTYVEKSAKLADGLKETLMVAAADWTETTKKFTMYGDSAYTSATDTLIMTFDCKVNDDASGTLSVSVRDDLSISDIEYEEMDVTVVPAIITIGGVTPPQHTCTLTKVPAKAATCTEAGNKEYWECKTCGNFYWDADGKNEITNKDKVIIEAGHKYGVLIAEVSATCGKNGVKAHYECSVCHKNFDTNFDELTDLVIPATGEHDWEIIKGADGSNTHTLKCKVCNTTVDEVHAGDDVNKKTWSADDDYHWHEFACGTRMDLAAHTWDEGVVTTPATCTTDGVKTYTCKVCSETKTEPIKATGHSMTKTPAQAATCTEPGNSEYYTCGNCGKFFSDEAGKNEIAKDSWVIKALGHKLTKTEAKAATCTEAGNNEYYTCATCNKFFSDADGKNEIAKDSWIIKALGHKLTKTEAKAATCTEAGNNAYWTCDTCGQVFKDEQGTQPTTVDAETINATGHTPKTDWTTDGDYHWHVCDKCGAVVGDKAAHTFDTNDCTKDRKCTECGYEKKAGQHAWVDKTYTWSDDFKCTATTKCISCQEPLTEKVDGVKTTVPATCVADGKDVYTATFTNTAFETQTKEVTIDKLGHTYGAPVWSWSEDGKTATATFTCTREGCTAETTGHAQTVTATVSGKQNVAPTCTDKGTTTYTAKVTFETKDYADTKDVQDIKALGHKLTKTPAKAATCTEPGNNEYWTCSVCKKVFKADKTTETTVAAETLAALGHKLTETPAVTPTCAAGGNNEYWTCSVCHKVFKADKTTETTVAKETLAKDPDNHTGGKELRGAVAASCMTAGRTDDTYCKGCGKLTKAGDLIPPTGVHNYKDGVCTTCGSKQPADNATIKAAIEKVVADVKEAVEEVLDKAIENETDANTKEILKKLKGYVSGSSRSKLQAVYSVTMSLNGQNLGKGDSLADGQNVTIAISEETYNALKSGAKIVESYLDDKGVAQTREINATLKQVGDGYTVTFAADKTAVYGLMTKTSSGGSSGSGSSYTSGQSFTTDLPADSINRVTVNGKKLDSKYYTVSSNGSGSIVTLTDAYLATLKAGKYTVKIENKTHVSTGTFTIKADGTLSSPKTADAGIALYAMLAVSSLMGTAVVSKKRRKA